MRTNENNNSANIIRYILENSRLPIATILASFVSTQSEDSSDGAIFISEKSKKKTAQRINSRLMETIREHSFSNLKTLPDIKKAAGKACDEIKDFFEEDKIKDNKEDSQAKIYFLKLVEKVEEDAIRTAYRNT